MGAIILNDKYRVEVDDKQFTLKSKSISENKTTHEKAEVWTSKGHFGIWDNLLNKVSQLENAGKVEKKVLVSLKEYEGVLIETRDEIKRIGKQLN